MSDKEQLESLKKERRELVGKIHVLDAEAAYGERVLGAIDFIRSFGKDKIVLNKPAAKFSHQFREALKKGEALNIQHDRELLDYEKLIFADAHYFLVQHDWAAAFKGATDYEGGEYRLPFEVCVFEFKINDCKVLVPAIELETEIKITPIFETPNGWAIVGYTFDVGENWSVDGLPEGTTVELKAVGNILRFIIEQIRAICIALEVGVAETELHETPEKLNRARARAGKPPISDHRVIYLSRRGHSGEAGDGTGSRKRLHFRRGHWRHYEDRRVWIRWTLVGNPDLGFVEQEYRL